MCVLTAAVSQRQAKSQERHTDLAIQHPAPKCQQNPFRLHYLPFGSIFVLCILLSVLSEVVILLLSYPYVSQSLYVSYGDTTFYCAV